MSDRPTFAKVEPVKYDHDYEDEAGYCRRCGAQELFHDKEKVDAIFDMMERWSSQ
jgi:hypothetical protein